MFRNMVQEQTLKRLTLLVPILDVLESLFHWENVLLVDSSYETPGFAVVHLEFELDQDVIFLLEAFVREYHYFVIGVETYRFAVYQDFAAY